MITDMTAADIRAIAGRVYLDLMATGAEEAYQMLLAELPRPGASVDEEWAYAGPELEEPTPAAGASADAGGQT